MGHDDEDWDRGWYGSDKFICPDCVGDDYLKTVVTGAVADGEECWFCDATSAAPFDVFMEALMVGVNNQFEQADDANMPWEGGYVFDDEIHGPYDLADTFAEVTAGDHADKVLEEIRDRLVDKAYVFRWWADSEPEEAYSTAWKDFREQIMHRTRFVFWATARAADRYKGALDVPVASVLKRIGDLLVQFSLITTLPTGTLTYRARGHTQADESQEWGAADLGTNLPDKSTNSTRMAPAGIPLFYSADNTDTALAEVAHADRREFFTIGQFATTKPITVIDLTNVPDIPSIFDPEHGQWQGELIFLNDLVKELSAPVDTARSNLDYVPTQVFCEYFLRVFDEADIHGLAWTSAATADSGRCLALDIRHEDCVDIADSTTEGPQLELVADGITIHQRRTDEFRQI